MISLQFLVVLRKFEPKFWALCTITRLKSILKQKQIGITHYVRVIQTEKQCNSPESDGILKRWKVRALFSNSLPAAGFRCIFLKVIQFFLISWYLGHTYSLINRFIFWVVNRNTKIWQKLWICWVCACGVRAQFFANVQDSCQIQTTLPLCPHTIPSQHPKTKTNWYHTQPHRIPTEKIYLKGLPPQHSN